MKFRAWIIVFIVLVPVCLWAQTGGVSGEVSPVLPLAEKVIVLAGMVTALLQGVKKLLPAIGGPLAIALNIVLSIAANYAAAQPGQVLTLQFIFSVILTALGASGVHALLRPAAKPTG